MIFHVSSNYIYNSESKKNLTKKFKGITAYLQNLEYKLYKNPMPNRITKNSKPYETTL